MKPVMYIFANKGLKMSPGKLSAQVGHAVGRVVRDAYTDGNVPATMNGYFASGETKIVLEARDEDHLRNIERYLNDHGVKTFMVIDEGRTEIPSHSITALGVEIVDKSEPKIQFLFEGFKTYKDEARYTEKDLVDGWQTGWRVGNEAPRTPFWRALTGRYKI